MLYICCIRISIIITTSQCQLGVRGFLYSFPVTIGQNKWNLQAHHTFHLRIPRVFSQSLLTSTSKKKRGTNECFFCTYITPFNVYQMAKMVIILCCVVLLHSFELCSVSSFPKQGTKTSRQPNSQKEKTTTTATKTRTKKLHTTLCHYALFHNFIKFKLCKECVRGNHALRNVFQTNPFCICTSPVIFPSTVGKCLFIGFSLSSGSRKIKNRYVYEKALPINTTESLHKAHMRFPPILIKKLSEKRCTV